MVSWKLEEMSNQQRQQLATAIDNEPARRSTVKERAECLTLGREGTYQKGLVNIYSKILVRIIRRYSGRSRCYDDDNFSGGCKSLRDSLASTLGLKGDSTEDGITFEYAQERADKTETVIKIYSKG